MPKTQTKRVVKSRAKNSSQLMPAANSKGQWHILIVTGLAILILSVVTAWSLSRVRTDILGQSKNPSPIGDEEFDYEKFLASIKPDPAASQSLLEKVVTEEDIKKQIETDLAVNQYIPDTQIPSSRIRLTTQNTDDAVTKYFEDVITKTQEYNLKTLAAAEGYFINAISPAKIQANLESTEALIDELYTTPVPADAAGYHKSQIATFEEFAELTRSALRYANGQNDQPWSNLYKNYIVINDQVSKMDTEFVKLDKKYGIAGSTIAVGPPEANGILGIKSAQALPVTVIGNVYDGIKDAIKRALAAVFTAFMNKFLDTFINKLESTFVIANQLFYSDALVRGKYAEDYTEKYIQDPVDQEMIKRFMPQFNCGEQRDYKEVFKAKAQQFLKYDPTKIDFTKPGFEEQMVAFGTPKALPQGWETIYRDVSQIALSKALKSATDEINSPGKKSLQDEIGKKIKSSLDGIKNSQLAALINQLSLGTSNPESLVGQLVSAVVTAVFNKFVFQGAVFKELNVCATMPTINPMLPKAEGEPEKPEDPPTDQDLINEYIRKRQY